MNINQLQVFKLNTISLDSGNIYYKNFNLFVVSNTKV